MRRLVVVGHKKANFHTIYETVSLTEPEWHPRNIVEEEPDYDLLRKIDIESEDRV